MILTIDIDDAALDLSSIYCENRGWMVHEAESWCGGAAQDLVHDTFLRILQRGREQALLAMKSPDQARFLRRCLMNQIHKEWTRSSRLRRGGGGVASTVSLQALIESGELGDLPDGRSSCFAGVEPLTIDEIQNALVQLEQSMRPDAWFRIKPYLTMADHSSDDERDGTLSGAMRTALCRARSKLRQILQAF